MTHQHLSIAAREGELGARVRELLRHVDAAWTDAELHPLVAALADALRECDPDEVDLLQQKCAEIEGNADRRETAAQQEGWEHGLEVARERLGAAMHANLEAPGGRCIDTVNGVDSALNRLDRELELAELAGFDEYGPSQSICTRSAASAHAEPDRVARSHLNKTPRDLVMEMIPIGRNELRENVMRELVETHRYPGSTAAMALKRLIGDGKPLSEIQVGKYKVLKRVA